MKKISLTQGKFALIDGDDFDRVSQYNWYARKDKRNYYAMSCDHNGNKQHLHRLILNLEDHALMVDHKNGNTLDNRKSNLRYATNSQNVMNAHKLKSNNTSGFRGVHKTKEGNWMARIYVSKGKRKSLGTFKTPEEAARVFDKAAKEIYGEFCGKLNFT